MTLLSNWNEKKRLKLEEYIKKSNKLSNQKRIPWRGDTPIPFDTYKVPINLLSYNFNNTRIRSELTAYLQKTKKELNSNDPEQIEQVENILLNSRWFGEMATITLKEDLRTRGQLDTAVITPDGVLIDGNRRFAIFNHYSKDEPHENYSFMEVCVLPVDSTLDELKALEMRLQMSQEFKLGYGEINTALEFRYLHESLGWGIEEITKVTMRHYKESKVRDMIRTIGIIDDCLQNYPPYGNHSKQYNLLDKGWESFMNLMNLLKWTEKKNPNDEELFNRRKLFGFQIIMNEKTTYRDVRNFAQIIRNNEAKKELEKISKTLQGIKLQNIFDKSRMEEERENLEYANDIREEIIVSPIIRARDALKKIQSIKVKKTRESNYELTKIFDLIIYKTTELKKKFS